LAMMPTHPSPGPGGGRAVGTRRPHRPPHLLRRRRRGAHRCGQPRSVALRSVLRAACRLGQELSEIPVAAFDRLEQEGRDIRDLSFPGESLVGLTALAHWLPGKCPAARTSPTRTLRTVTARDTLLDSSVTRDLVEHSVLRAVVV